MRGELCGLQSLVGYVKSIQYMLPLLLSASSSSRLNLDDLQVVKGPNHLLLYNRMSFGIMEPVAQLLVLLALVSVLTRRFLQKQLDARQLKLPIKSR